MFHQTNTIPDDISMLEYIRLTCMMNRCQTLQYLEGVLGEAFGNSSVTGFCQTPLYT